MNSKSKRWDTLSTIIKSALWGALLLVCLKYTFSSLESVYDNASLIKSPSIAKKAKETLVALLDLEREVKQARQRERIQHQPLYTLEMLQAEKARRLALTPEAARIEESRRKAAKKFEQNPEEINSEINHIIRGKCRDCGLVYNIPKDSKNIIDIHNELKKTISEVDNYTSQDYVALSNKKHSIELISSFLVLIFGFYLIYCLVSFNKIGWKGISVNFLLAMPFMLFEFGNPTGLFIYLFLVYPPIFALAKKRGFDLKRNFLIKRVNGFK